VGIRKSEYQEPLSLIIDYLLLIIGCGIKNRVNQRSPREIDKYVISWGKSVSEFVFCLDWIPVFTGMTGGAIGSGTRAGRPRDTRARCPRHVNKESPATVLRPETLSTKPEILNNPKCPKFE